MTIPLLAQVDPWQLELIVVSLSHSGAERRAISRDVERGLLLRVQPRAYVERTAFESMSIEDQHVVRMRALVAVASCTVVFSHWSAAVPQGLPVMRARLRSLHTTVSDDDDRHRHGVNVHHFLLDDAEIVEFGDLLVTGVGRTVVDVAGAAPFEEGVMAADAALRAGVPRAMLEAAVDLAGPRRAGRRISEVVAFAHPGADSAGESRGRVTMLRLGVDVPVLQHRIVLRGGVERFLDFFFRRQRVGGEFDGDQKYLDPRMAPKGAGAAIVAEKRREDELRLGLDGLARFGWVQAGSMAALRGILTRVGVVAPRPRATLADYSAEARAARPRLLPRRPRWRA